MQALPVSEFVRTVALCVARVLYVTCVDLGRVHLHPSSGRGRANVERVVFTRMLSVGNWHIFVYIYTLVSRDTKSAKCRRLSSLLSLSYGFSQRTYEYWLLGIRVSL